MSLFVTVTYRPSGRRVDEKLLHTIEIQNISDLAEISNYKVEHVYHNKEYSKISMTRPVNYIFTILDHKRSDGAIALLKRVFKELL